MVASDTAAGAIKRAFGAENRARLLEQYLDGNAPVTPADAWMRVYELLLWIDRTTGLAHCYESDKCQPGRPWYARSLAFHDWLAWRIGVTAGEVAGVIDWLFRTAIADLAKASSAKTSAAAAAQRLPYEGRDFPLPGEHPELVDIIVEELGAYLAGAPSNETWQLLTKRIHTHLGQENKRKNLLGEGFEDTLAAVIARLPGARALTVKNRVLLGDVPGFHPQGDVEERKRVDVALWKPGGKRYLVTSKWSIRADREEQFGTDFEAYVRVNGGGPFEYVLVTNEFDPARLKNACERLAGNAHLFTSVVRVNPEGVLAAYGDQAHRGAASAIEGFVRSGRLQSLEQWLTTTLA